MKRTIALAFFIAIVVMAFSVEWWVAIAMLAIALYGSLILVDGFCFKCNVYTHAEQPLAISAIVQMLPWIAFPFINVNLEFSAGTTFAFVSGGVSMIAFWFYFKAMQYDQDGFVISVMLNMMLATVPLVAYYTIGEKLELVQYVGISIIFVGAMIATYKKARTDVRVIVLMLGAVLLFTVSMTTMKQAYIVLGAESNSVYWEGVLARALGCGVVGLVYVVKSTQNTDSRQSFFALVKVFWPMFLIIETLQVLADMLTILATSAGDVSLVIAMDGLLGIFIAGQSVILVYVLTLTKAKFGLLRTAVQLRNDQFDHYVFKIIGMLCITVGAYIAT